MHVSGFLTSLLAHFLNKNDLKHPWNEKEMDLNWTCNVTKWQPVDHQGDRVGTEKREYKQKAINSIEG